MNIKSAELQAQRTHQSLGCHLFSRLFRKLHNHKNQRHQAARYPQLNNDNNVLNCDKIVIFVKIFFARQNLQKWKNFLVNI